MLLQPLMQRAGGTPVAGRGTAFTHHQSCHVDLRGFKPLQMERGDGEEPRDIQLSKARLDIVCTDPLLSPTRQSVIPSLLSQVVLNMGPECPREQKMVLSLVLKQVYKSSL